MIPGICLVILSMTKCVGIHEMYHKLHIYEFQVDFRGNVLDFMLYDKVISVQNTHTQNCNWYSNLENQSIEKYKNGVLMNVLSRAFDVKIEFQVKTVSFWEKRIILESTFIINHSTPRIHLQHQCLIE